MWIVCFFEKNKFMVRKIKLHLFGLVFLSFSFLLVLSCSSDDDKELTFPLSADIFNSVSDRQVAFQGLTHNAVAWSWDFGDGNTSTEQNPVHVYESGGYYTAVLTATDNTGGVVTDEVQLAIALTPYVLLTGGPTNINGKTWKLAPSHSTNGDYFAWANQDLSPFEGTPDPLPDGAFNLFLGMPEVYDDEFTFHFDGSYEVNVLTGAAFSGYIYQLFTTGGAGIVNAGGASFGLCTGLYTPETAATFTYEAEEDYTILSAIAGGPLTYPGVSTIDFSEGSYLGFLDFNRKVIIQEITDSSMKMVVFASLDFAAAQAGGASTHGFVLSFEVVN